MHFQDTKIKNQLKVKLEMTKFLQGTLDEMALQAKGESHSHAAKEFSQFFESVRLRTFLFLILIITKT